MIEPIRIKLSGDEVEIASGDYHGHVVTTFSAKTGEGTRTWYVVGAETFPCLAAALNACMARAYAYVAQQEADAEYDRT